MLLKPTLLQLHAEEKRCEARGFHTGLGRVGGERRDVRIVAPAQAHDQFIDVHGGEQRIPGEGDRPARGFGRSQRAELAACDPSEQQRLQRLQHAAREPAAFAAHAALKTPAAVRNLRRPREEGELVSPAPAPPTVSRRGALGLVGAGSLLLFGATAGRGFDGPLRRTALLAPHGGADPAGGPGGFQINKTAAYAGISAAEPATRKLRAQHRCSCRPPGFSPGCPGFIRTPH